MRDRCKLFVCGLDVRGALAGNGGEMAVIKQELKAKKPSSGQGSGSRRRPTSKAGSRAGSKAGKRVGTKAPIDVPDELNEADGAEMLREAANKAAAKNSLLIAQKLVEKAAAGDAPSTKMLLALMGGKKPARKKRPGEQTPAEILTLDEPWKGTLGDDAGETGEGGGRGAKD